jgi:hypothetical protein
MTTYQQKLVEFAQGKRLLRLPHPVRDRADAFCDACGSSQPRTLYALKDLGSEHYYFVGDICLKGLAKLGAILRRYGRESGQKVYESEMQFRVQELSQDKVISESGPTGTRTSAPERSHPARNGSLTSANGLCPFISLTFIIETQEQYRVFVFILSDKGTNSGWGYAQEARYDEVWARRDEGNLLLEKLKQERAGALGLCFARACEEAISQFKGPQLTQLTDGVGAEPLGGGIPNPLLLTLVRLVSGASLDGHPSSSLNNDR